jgi:uncharacterized membrane protein YczE
MPTGYTCPGAVDRRNPSPARRFLLTLSTGRRLAQLLCGLAVYGVSDGLIISAGLGVEPWDALSQGLSRTVGLGIGTWTNIIGAFVLLLWIPLRQVPGFGTLCNVAIVGTACNFELAWVPAPRAGWLRVMVLAGGIVANAAATGCYIGAGAGPGPRDGLTTGWAARGPSLRVARWTVEVSVLALGYLLGATIGIGTLAYAIAIGPLLQVFIPLFRAADGTTATRNRKAAPGYGRAGGRRVADVGGTDAWTALQPDHDQHADD